MLELKMRRITHPMQCSIHRCTSRDTFTINRGVTRDDPVHICTGCIVDIACGYAEKIGVDRAREVFGRLVEYLGSADEAKSDEAVSKENEAVAEEAEVKPRAVK